MELYSGGINLGVNTLNFGTSPTNYDIKLLRPNAGIIQTNNGSSLAGQFQTAIFEQAVTTGALVSASTIAPAVGISHVSGTAAIATITPPSGMSSTIGGCITLIADAAWTTTTAGNIQAAMTAVANTPYRACYDGSKWFIK
jgi:hypothetical protein